MYGGGAARAGRADPEGDLRALIESTNDLLWSVDLNLNLVAYNRSFADVAGRGGGTRTLPGMCPERLWPGPAAEIWRERYHRVLMSGVLRTEHTFFEGCSYELTFRPMGETGAATGVAVSGREITDRVWRDRSMAMQRASGDGVVLIDLNGAIREVNPAYCELSGFNFEELTGMNLADLEIDGEFARVQREMATGGWGRYNGHHRTKNAGAIAVEVTIEQQAFDGGLRAVSVRVFGGEERGGNRSESTEAKFATPFRSTPAITTVASLDDGGRLIDVNDAFVRCTGYGRDEVIGRTGQEVGYWVDPRQFEAAAGELRRRGSLRDFEFAFRTKSGDERTGLMSAEQILIDGVRCAISTTIDITERKRADATARSIQERHRSILQTAIDGILVASGEGKLLEVNDALCRMTGYSANELLALRLSDLDAEGAAEEMAGGNSGFQSRWRRKDGSILELEVNGQYQPEDGGRYVVFLRDITAQNEAAEALRASERKFAAAFDSNPAMEVLFRLDGGEKRLIDANAAFTSTTGYVREEVIGTRWDELKFWASREDPKAIADLLRTDRHVRNFEYRFVSKAGVECVGLLSAEEIEIDGAPCAIATTIDVTEWRRAEEAMGSLPKAIEHAEEQVVITDPDGTIRYCNPAVEKATGYSRHELIGQNPRVLKSGKHGAAFYRELWETLNGQGVWRGHLINKKKDGTLYEEEATISPITNAAGRTTGFVAIKRDVTASMLLEAQLHQAQKLESIGRLAGGIAHDFNNLLTVINGYTVFLLNRLRPSDPSRVYAEHIAKAGEQAAALTRQLLAFSRKQVIEPKPLDINRAITDTVPMLQRLIGENIRIAATKLAATDRIMGDASQINQLIMNLAVNARDAMPEGGRIEITTAHVDIIEPDAVLHGDTKPGRYVLLTVCDNGCGIPDSVRAQIFDPFFTTKAPGKGTGLGLSTVHGIVKQNGGAIHVMSEEGSGTSFRIYLPRMAGVPQEATDAIEARRLPVAPRGVESGETVLLVEDQMAVRTLVKAMLRRYGYQVIEAGDAEEALRIVARFARGIDMLLADIVLPGLNGKQLAARVREVRPDVRILFISGYSREDIAGRGVGELDGAFLQKPFQPEVLAAAVRDVLIKEEPYAM